MFGSSKNNDDSKNTPSVLSTSLNALAKGTKVEGTVRCDSDLRIDGIIKGKLICKAKVIIGPTGAVEGEIECQNAVVEGRFNGILRVAELLNVRETAEVDGEISTNKLLVQSGARFNVSCKMEIGTNANGAVKTQEVKTSNEASKIAGGKTEVRN
ncbi:MAG: polymer-forming cytoskeletal protein [Lewinellaceae bacterium]|nr:polymer-forming cytoskeletal protein [Lewinellaceae bacterium]